MVSLAAREWIADGKGQGKAQGRRFGPVPDNVRARVEPDPLAAIRPPASMVTVPDRAWMSRGAVIAEFPSAVGE